MSSTSALRKNHSALLSGCWDIFRNIDYTSSQSYGIHENQTSIVCRGKDNSADMEYEMRASSYGGSSAFLAPDHVHFVKGRLIAPNTDTIHSFYFDSDRPVTACDSDTFKGSLANSTALTGLGIIISREELMEQGYEKSSIVAVLRHSDYDPSTKKMVTFNLEYRCRPLRYLENLRSLFRVGREAQVTGYIIDWDKVRKRWVCDVTGINLTSGSETIPDVTSPPNADDGANLQVTATGRIRANFKRKCSEIDGLSSTDTRSTAGPSSSILPSAPSEAGLFTAENSMKVGQTGDCEAGEENVPTKSKKGSKKK